jgi:hypothetical protein
MTKRHWREVVEIVGVVSIVASLMLLAAQVRQSNDIAAAQSGLQIADSFSALHLERASNPDFAKLFPKLEGPEAHLTTATDASQIRGIAWHYINIMWSVHIAYENGLIDKKTRNDYILVFAANLERWPGIRPHYVKIYRDLETIQGLKVYAPIAEHIATLEPTEPVE